MKKYLLFFVFLLACGEKEDNTEQAISTEVDIPEQEHWVVYEGVVRSDEGSDVRIALSLLQGEVGLPSKYTTEEEYIGINDRILTRSSGSYTLTYGNGDEMLVNINENKGYSLMYMEGEYSINPLKVSPEKTQKAKISKLSFKTGRNSDELLFLGSDGMPVVTGKRSHRMKLLSFMR